MANELCPPLADLQMLSTSTLVEALQELSQEILDSRLTADHKLDAAFLVEACARLLQDGRV